MAQTAIHPGEHLAERLNELGMSGGSRREGLTMMSLSWTWTPCRLSDSRPFAGMPAARTESTYRRNRLTLNVLGRGPSQRGPTLR